MSRPIATLALAATVLAGYGLELTRGGETFCLAHGFTPAHPSFETAFSSLFLHQGLFHLGGNLAFLAVFGTIVELELGSVALLALFAAAGLGGAGIHYLVDPGSTTTLVGASGALFGVLAVAGVLRPRLLAFVVVFVGINVWNAFTGGDGAVSFGCHIGGFLVGAVAAVSWRAMGSTTASPLRKVKS